MLLIHGDQDQLIPVQALMHAAQGLAALEVPAEWHISPGIGHGIDQEGLRQGGEFLADAFASAQIAALAGNSPSATSQSRHAALLLGVLAAWRQRSKEVEERRLNVHVSPAGFPALVLNADFRPLSYYPLSLWSWQDAIKAVFLERVNIVANYDRAVRSPSFEMKLPSVVSLKTFVKPSPIRLSRDSTFSCATASPANIAADRDDLTFDHVTPAVARRAHDWDNVVTACSPCNLRKGNLTPTKPGCCLANAVPAHGASSASQWALFPPNYLHESWLDYLYWDTELEP